MTATDNFARTLEQFTLQNIRVFGESGLASDKLLVGGFSTTVLELQYNGLKCAGKKIHDWLLKDQASDSKNIICRFEEECEFLSQIRHPNIVHFLGVYFQQGVRVPILVVEFLPTNLTSCIEQYGILPKETSYSILHDVALGLCYLHSQTPAIIHRDLSSNNVLLTPNMTAKISDLGKAKILTNVQAANGMTKKPGETSFMPPEAMMAKPKYDTCIDEFSYGIMMIHVFSGQWPEPQVGPIRTETDGKMIPVSEAERREVFLQDIGNDHLLMDLILKCIHNNTRERPHATEIVERLAEMVLQFPASFANRLEMAKEIYYLKSQIAALNEDNQLLKEKQEVIEPKSKIAQRVDSKASDLKIETQLGK